MDLQQDSNGVCVFNDTQPFLLQHGAVLPQLRLAYETYGHLSAAKDNVVLIHHALSTHSHVCAQAANPTPGWWEGMVGPGCPIDTERYYVICINNLGSCFGSSGPTTPMPDSAQAYRMAFPRITIADMVHAQHRLLQALDIARIAVLVGPSMGGMLALTWAVHYPKTVQRLILIASSLRAYPVHVAMRSIQREVIRLDPSWQEGNYPDGALLAGFCLARQLGHLSYRHPDELNRRFAETAEPASPKRFTVNAYLAHNAERFIRAFDANSYLYLTQAMDEFSIATGFDSEQHALARVCAAVLVIAIDSDLLFPPWQQQALHAGLQDAGVNSTLLHYTSTYGHDAFLVETAHMGQILQDFMCSEVQKN